MTNKYCNLIGTNNINDEFAKINDGFTAVEADSNSANIRMSSHVNGVSEKHAAEKITYTGEATGDNVKGAIDNLKADINNLSFTGSEHDALVTAALIDEENENFGPEGVGTYLAGRLAKWEQRAIVHMAESTHIDADILDLQTNKANKTEVNTLATDKANQSDLLVERARIDSFTTLAAGSTTGDAELIDARIGVDGSAYANAGGAIRGQINELKSDLKQYDDRLFDIDGKVYIAFESGSIATGGSSPGTEISSTIYVRSKDYFLWASDLVCDIDSTMVATFFFFDANKGYLGATGNLTGQYLFKNKVVLNPVYYRIVTRKSDSSLFSDYTNLVSVYINDNIPNRLSAVENLDDLLVTHITKTLWVDKDWIITDAVDGRPVGASIKFVTPQSGTGIPSRTNPRGIIAKSNCNLVLTNGTDSVNHIINTSLYGIHANEDNVAIGTDGTVTVTHKTRYAQMVGSNSWSGHYRNGKGLWVAGAAGAAAKTGAWAISDILATADSYSTADVDSICPSVSGTILVALTDASTGLTASSTTTEVSAAFNTFFASHNASIVYPLATPTTETFTITPYVMPSGEVTVECNNNGVMNISYDIDTQKQQDVDNIVLPDVGAKECVVTFSCDDGIKGDYKVLNIWSEIFGFPMTIFVATNNLSDVGMNQYHMLRWQNELKCEIGSHTQNHGYLTSLTTDEEIRNNWTDSIDHLASLGCNVETCAYPEGAHNANVRRITKGLFKCAAGGPDKNRKMYDGAVPSMDVKRVILGFMDDVAPSEDYPIANSFEYYKCLVDEAVRKKAWIIFVMHAGNTNYTTEQKTITYELMSYIHDQGITVKTFGDAWDYVKGFEYGDSVSSEKNNGLSISPRGGTNQLTRLFNTSEGSLSGLSSQTPIEDFPNNAVSYSPIENGIALGFPASGVLVTDKSADLEDLWSQTISAYNVSGAVFKRRFSNGLPTDFVPINPYGFATVSRPSCVEVGYCGFDTTLGKPIWCTSKGSAEQDILTITSGATANGNISITLNGVTFSVDVTSGMDIEGMRSAIVSASFDGWSVYSKKYSAKVRFIKNNGGVIASPTFGADGTGCTGTIATDITGYTATWKDASETVV